jgi:putative addiction module component (TIGR02574 family)
MNTAAIRQKLHNYLEVADDKKVKAIYTMVEETIDDNMVAYTDEFKAELDRRYSAYNDGSEAAITATESKKRIQKLLKTASK